MLQSCCGMVEGLDFKATSYFHGVSAMWGGGGAFKGLSGWFEGFLFFTVELHFLVSLRLEMRG